MKVDEVFTIAGKLVFHGECQRSDSKWIKGPAELIVDDVLLREIQIGGELLINRIHPTGPMDDNLGTSLVAERLDDLSASDLMGKKLFLRSVK